MFLRDSNSIAALLEQATKQKVGVDKKPPDSAVDFIMTAAGTTFLIEAKGNARSSTVAGAIAQLDRYREYFADARPLIVVPKMGATGAELCARSGINWLDLSGNAVLDVPGLRVHIEGRTVKTATEASGFNPFSREASRVVHALLLDPRHDWTRERLASTTNLNKGTVTRTVGALLESGLIDESRAKGRSRPLSVVDPETLLDAWSERYRKPKPDIFGLLPTPDGFDTVRRIVDILASSKVEIAFTGLAAAASYTEFGSFRRTNLYAAEPLPEEALRRLHQASDPRGRNVIVTYDRAAFALGRQSVRGATYVSPVLAYLDLLYESERAAEARDELRPYIRRRFWS